jgi:redox-sensitive bicupin YhaK (pirin superfamily)
VIGLRRSRERGRGEHGWLDSRHTFSFAGYQDPRFMGFSVLRVINEDRVAPGAGFGTHAHRDMEILTWVLEGALEHRDSLGNGSVIRPGDVQRMSAGTGITHSEYNPSPTEPVHFLQIWVLPEHTGLAPGYEQKRLDWEGGLRLVAARDGRDGSVTLHQDASLHAARLAQGERARLDLAPGRRAWVQVARGALALGPPEGSRPLALLEAGDGASLEGEPAVELAARAASEVLVFDLP